MQKFLRKRSPCKPSAEISALVAAVRQRHGDAVAGVLFYGSCMRSGRFDGGIADLYLLVDDYASAYDSRFRAFLNRLLPPNVFYLEVPFGSKTLRAKFAVLSLDDFRRGSRQWFHSYIWGRFAQPVDLVYARDPQVSAGIHEALAWSVRTLLKRALPQTVPGFSTRDLWTTALSLSYCCELRSERPGTAVRLFDADPDYYEVVTREVLRDPGFAAEVPIHTESGSFRVGVSRGRRRINSFGWRLRRVQGKWLSVLRLLKALLTFDRGMDYALWKIERHSGVQVEVSPALRRFPPLAACVMLWRLFRKGAFR